MFNNNDNKSMPQKVQFNTPKRTTNANIASGNFTNLIYDNESYNEKLQMSVAPMSYILNPINYINTNQCYSLDTLNASNSGAVSTGNQIDIDSVLKNIDNINSKSTRMNHPQSLKQYPSYMLNTCSSQNDINTKYTRLTDPATNIRGLTDYRLNFGFPKYDPQCNIFEDFAVNTQLQAKDTFISTWQIPLNSNNSQPTTKLGNVVECREINQYASAFN